MLLTLGLGNVSGALTCSYSCISKSTSFGHDLHCYVWFAQQSMWWVLRVLGAVLMGIGIHGAETLIPQRLVETLVSGFAWGEQGLSRSEFWNASRPFGNCSEKSPYANVHKGVVDTSELLWTMVPKNIDFFPASYSLEVAEGCLWYLSFKCRISMCSTCIDVTEFGLFNQNLTHYLRFSVVENAFLEASCLF